MITFLKAALSLHPAAAWIPWHAKNKTTIRSMINIGYKNKELPMTEKTMESFLGL